MIMKKKIIIMLVLVILIEYWYPFLCTHADNDEGTGLSKAVVWSGVKNPDNYRATFKIYDSTNNQKISCIEDLVDLSLAVENGGQIGEKIELTKTLDFNDPSSYKNANRTDYGDINGNNIEESLINELTTGNGFSPIGGKNAFSGEFYGQGYEIKNLYINRSDIQYLGLFGMVNFGKIRDLGVSGKIINNYQTEDIELEKKSCTGGIAGRIGDFSNIENCYNSVTIESHCMGGIVGSIYGNGSVKYCQNNIHIGNSICAGGIAGTIVNNNETNIFNISHCYNIGDIVIECNDLNCDRYIGGIVGKYKYGRISNCYNQGNLRISTKNEIGKLCAGGIAGTSGVLTCCYNTGSIFADVESKTAYIGGIVGTRETGAKVKNAVSSCYNTGNINATKSNENYGEVFVAGVVGYSGQSGYSSGANCLIVNSYNKGYINLDIKETQDYTSGWVAGITCVPQGADSQDIVGRRGNVFNCYNSGIITPKSVYYSGAISAGSGIDESMVNGDYDYICNQVFFLDISNEIGCGNNRNRYNYEDLVSANNNAIQNQNLFRMTAKEMMSSNFTEMLNSVRGRALNNEKYKYFTDENCIWNEWKQDSGDYPTFDINIETGNVVYPAQEEENGTVQEQTITGNGTITANVSSKEDCTIVMDKAERLDKSKNEWIVLEENKDYKVEQTDDSFNISLIYKQREIDGITYELNTDENMATVITAKEQVISQNQVIIPDVVEVDGVSYTVVRIGKYAFKNGRFNDIHLPGMLSIIEEYAFDNCINLTQITIPNSVSYIHINAFPTHNVTINIDPDNPNYSMIDGILYSKDGSILYGATKAINVETFVVPDNVSIIKENAFSYYGNLRDITIGKNVIAIAQSAFDNVKESLTITGYKHSIAEEYANQNNIVFNAIYTGFFIWEEDNYNFINSKPPFSGYYIGDDIYNRLSNAYREEYNNDPDIINGTWGGSCEGMAQSTILMKYGFLTPQYWQVNGKEANFEYQMEYNNKLLYMINFYQMFQHTTRARMFFKTDIQGQGEYEGFYNGVKNAYESLPNRLLLCTFNWRKKENGEDKFCGHAIVIINGPETLDEQFYATHGSVFSYYRYRIPVYDVNSSEENYIYISEDFSKLTIGSDSQLGNYATTASSQDSAGDIKEINAYRLNENSVISIENIIQNNEFDVFQNGARGVRYNATKGIRICDGEGKFALIEGNTTEPSEGDLECVVEPTLGATANNDNSITQNNVMFMDGDVYTAESINQNDPFDVGIQFGDSYMTAKTELGGSATFENKKSVSLVNPSGGKFETSVTLNNEFVTLPWYTITATGEDAKELKLEMQDEGVLISGDNLTNLVVKGNNSSEISEINIDTEYDSVMLKLDSRNGTFIAYVDTDGDGSFETILKDNSYDVEQSEETEQNQRLDKNIKAGDKVDCVVITLIISIIAIICMIIIKYTAA